MRKQLGGLIVLIALFGLVGCSNNQGAHTHEYGDWKIVKQASCTQAGEQVRSCDCGEEEMEEIPATGHTEVADAAVEPTCTTAGKTAGSHCSVCGKAIKEQKEVPARHQEEAMRTYAVTCTRAGKGRGLRCSVCGEILEFQKKIRAKGHQYENGRCTVCHALQPDMAAAILVDQLNEEKPANFITKKAYKGGSELSFNVYVPKGVGWWAVSWTTSKSNVGLYKWAAGTGVSPSVKAGAWQHVSVTLPDDGKNYYVYFVGAKNEWNGEALLIDDFAVKSASGKTTAEDTFDDGFDKGLFEVIKTNPTTGHAVVYEKEICPGRHKVVVDAAVAATCTEAGKTAGSHCSVCGKALKVQKVIPAAGHQWTDGTCVVCGKEQANTVVALQIDQLNEGAPANFITKKAYKGGSTVSFRVNVPKNVGWCAVSWTTKKSDVGLYKWAEGLGTSLTAQAGTWTECSVTLPNDGKSYYIYFVGEKDNWHGKSLLIDDFVVRDASGEEIAGDSFDAGIDKGLFQIVSTNPTTGKSAVSGKELCTSGHKIVTDKAVAATCTQAGLTAGSHCSVCGKIIKGQEVIPATGHQWTDGTCIVCGQEKENIVAAVCVDQLNESAPMNFITKQAYAGGSKISFKAYVPTGASWWAVCWTTNPSDADLYKWAEGKGVSLSSVDGAWSDYSVTLPNDGKDYYFYIVGAKGEWHDKELLLDEFVITDASGGLLDEDNFDNGIKNGIFNLIEKNPTSDRTVVHEKTIVDPCKKGHTVVTDPAVPATCTETGLTEGSHCSVCGKVLNAQTEIPATGHHYGDDGICIDCGAVFVDKAVAIQIDQLNENAPMNFITKEAYAGGTTLTLKAYVPAGVGWWAISWTTDPSDTGLYTWVDGHGQSMTAIYDSWATYTVTLPNDGNSYYIYIVGAKGEWHDKELLIDNVKLTDTSDNVLAQDTFDDGMTNGLFRIVEQNPTNEKIVVRELVVNDPCKNGHTLVVDAGREATCTEAGLTDGTHCSTCGKILNPQTEIPATGHHYGEDGKCVDCGHTLVDRMVSIVIDQLNAYQSDGKMNFITKKAYAGGSTVSFKAYVPTGASWWAVCWTTDPNQGDIYNWTSGLGQMMISTAGAWADYSVTLPDDGNEYYLYIAGAKGEWGGKELLLNDFQIQKGESIEKDSFDDGLTEGLFDVTAISPGNGSTVVACKETPKTDQVAAIKIDRLNENAPMSFITKNAYAGGSTVSFKGYVPAGTSWWAVCWTTNPSDADLYKWTGGAAYGKSMTSETDKWADYSVTLPDDGKQYYVYIVGAKGEWGGKELLIDDFAIEKGGTEVTDTFEAGVDMGLFSIAGNDVVYQKEVEK